MQYQKLKNRSHISLRLEISATTRKTHARLSRGTLRKPQRVKLDKLNDIKQIEHELQITA